MTTRYSQRLIIVQPAAGQALANTQALSVDTIGGAKTFTVPLSPTGAAPATHYWCSWAMQPSERTALSTLLGLLPTAQLPHLFDGLTFTPEQVLTLLSLQRISSLTVAV